MSPEPVPAAEYVATWDGLNPPYRTLVVDPPWKYEQGGPRAPHPSGAPWARVKPPPYRMMSAEQIAALPIADLAAADAHLYLWTTNRYLRDAFRIAEGWGFKHSQTLTWCKPPKGVGPGGSYSNTTEFVLFCRRGRLAHLSRANSTWWLWPRREHSVKPSEFYEVIEGVSPGPYLDLFARAARLGWDGWGDQYEGAA